MLRILTSPLPLVVALWNAMLGLLLVLGAYFALYFLSWDLLQIPAPPLRWLIGTALLPLIFVSVIGAMSGIAVGTVLIWGTPRSSNALRSLSFCALAFGACMPVALMASRFYWHTQGSLGIFAVIIVFAVSGGVMAFAMARAASTLGSRPSVTRGWIVGLGGVLPGLGVSAGIHFADLRYLEFLPMVWLGLVTYFCLKPLPQEPQTGL